MNSHFNHSSAPLVRVNRSRPCPTCGKHDAACSVRSDGVLGVCTQVVSPYPAGGCRPGWTHVFIASDRAPQVPVLAVKSKPQNSTLAPIERRHAIYSALLREHLVLADEHLQKLCARGFSHHAVECNAYRSTPTADFASSIARALAWRYDLTGVPGFYLHRGEWRMVNMRAGYLVPYRNLYGQIQAMQIRLDEPFNDGKVKYIWLSSADKPQGASPSTPLHIAGRNLVADSPDILISEGSLKADCASFLGGVPVVAGGGVSCFGHDFGEWFKTTFPAKRAVICFDSDWALKREVRAALQRLRTQLRDAGVPFVVRTWDARHKGIDDYLLALTLAHSAVLEVAA